MSPRSNNELPEPLQRLEDDLARAAREEMLAPSVAQRQSGSKRARTVPARSGVRGPVVAAAAATAIAALVLVLVLVVGGREPSLAARAYAALDERNAVLHVVIEQRSTRGERRLRPVLLERWQSGARGRVRVVADGRARLDVASNGDIVRTYEPRRRLVTETRSRRTASDPLADPLVQFRERYRRGQVRELGQARVAGRAVREILVQAAPRRIVYFVDAQTAAPVALRVQEGQGDFRENRYLLYERLPLTSQTRKLLELDVPPDARVVRSRSGR